MSESRDQCAAPLHHAHGVTLCDLPAGHEGRHRGWCDSCVDSGEDATLRWDQGVDRLRI